MFFCCCTSSPNTVTCRGCNNLPLPGTSVTVKDSGGAVVASGTTDSSGNFTFTAADGTYNVTVIPPTARLLGGTVPMTVSGPTTKVIGFFPASGYACYCQCVYPVLKNALKVDTPQGHTLTLNFNSTGGFWFINETYVTTATCDQPGVAANCTIQWKTGITGSCPGIAIFGCLPSNSTSCNPCSDNYLTPQSNFSGLCRATTTTGTVCPESGFPFSHSGTITGNPVVTGNWRFYE